MQFNSVQSGSFLAGAKSINENVTDIYNTAIQTGFAADKVIMQANANDAVKQMAAARRQASMGNAAINNLAEAKVTDIESKLPGQLKDIWRPAVRMEGINRMAGNIAAGAYIMDEGKKARAEYAEMKKLRQDRDAAQEKRAEAAAARDQKIIDLLTKKGARLQGDIDSLNSPDKKPSASNQPNSSSKVSADQPDITSLNTASTLPLMTPGWKKWTKVIRTGEGTLGDTGYRKMYGGGLFNDLSKHPDKVIHSGRYSSSAAGAYQFLTPTWQGAAKALKLKDFSPQSQEKAGRYLTRKRGVDPDKVITDFNSFKNALDKLAPEWASLPYQPRSEKGGLGKSYYGQGGISAEEAWRIYQSI